MNSSPISQRKALLHPLPSKTSTLLLAPKGAILPLSQPGKVGKLLQIPWIMTKSRTGVTVSSGFPFPAHPNAHQLKEQEITRGNGQAP